MKQRTSRTLAVLLAIVFVAACFACYPITASAASYVKGSNDASPSYKASKYYQYHQNVTLTGDGVTDVLAMAISQLGYLESNSADSLGGMTAGTKNFTEYNYNMGDYGQGYGGVYYWCASFVAWCLLQGGATNQNKMSHWCRNHFGDATYIWREVGCANWIKQLIQTGYGYLKGSGYVPVSGDLIFFSDNGNSASHIGLVLYCDGSTVYTIEGNTSPKNAQSNGDGVYFKSYSLTSSYIFGYGHLPYKTNSAIQRIDYSGANPTAGLYMSTTVKYLYPSETASSYSATLPKHTMFNVTKVCSNGRLQVSYNGGTYYVLNNSDRVIQLSSAANAGVTPPAPAPTLVGSCMDAYSIDGADTASKETPITVTAGQAVGLRGWAGYTAPISKYGYYLDGNAASAVWTTNAGGTTEDAIYAAGGQNARRFHIQASTASLSAGQHTINFVLQLSDGSVTELTSYKFTVQAAPVTEPETTTAEPETTTAEPETTTAEPETTTAEPETTTVEPETTTAEPETTTAEPETTTAEPETTTAEPETTTAEPETTTAEPETTTAEPETTTAEPETTTAEPETTTAEPETTTAEPEVTTTEPEETTTEPEVTTELDESSSEPEGTEKEPEATQPTAKPSQKKEGCKSTVSGALAIMALTTAAGALCLARKKDE